MKRQNIMKTNRRKLVVLGSLGLLATIAVFVSVRNAPPSAGGNNSDPSGRAEKSVETTPIDRIEPAAEIATREDRVGAPTTTEPTTTAVATDRMIAAHAPLRTPAVANPDSEENRQILQTMVLKALAATPTLDAEETPLTSR